MTDADRIREVIDVAEILLGWVNRWDRRMGIRPDDDVPERSRRMLGEDLARASLLLGGRHDIQEFIAEISKLRQPLSVMDAAEQVDSIARHLCNAYNINPRTLRPRKGFTPLNRQAQGSRRLTARVSTDAREGQEEIDLSVVESGPVDEV